MATNESLEQLEADVKASLHGLTKEQLEGVLVHLQAEKKEEEQLQLDPAAATVTLARRELKIQGQIGTSGQPDRLSFNSLARQIEDALQKGYKAREVISAVTRAVAPGVPLRSYLEGRPEVTLPQLRRILRAHFKERDAIDIYQELVAASQDQKESPHDFLIRA